MPERAAGLWRHPDFVRLWTGQTVSKFGSHITGTALPALAVITLAATPAQMGLLGALESAPILVFGLFAGVWVDRLRRRPLLIATDLARALVLASIPLAAWYGRLHIGLLYFVAALVGTLSVCFDLAGLSFLPVVVSRERLVEGNSKLGASDSVAEVAGPALAGTLVQWLTAPGAILIDCLSYLFSALCVGLIRTPEPPPVPPAHRQSVRREIGEGMRVVFGSPLLRALAGSWGTFEFCGNFIGTVYWLFLVRELGLSPAIVGLGIGMGGVGALIGAFLTEPVTRRFGIGRTLIGCQLLKGSLNLILPLTHGPKGVMIFLVLASQFVTDIPIAIYLISATSLRQAVIPSRLLGRANAGMNLLTRGVGPLGALLAGALGGIIGLRLTWIAGATGITLASLWLIFSPIRRLRHLPAAPAS